MAGTAARKTPSPMQDNNQNDPPGPGFDPFSLGQVMAHVTERAQPLLQQYFEQYGASIPSPADADPLNIQQAYAEFMTALMENPQRLVEMQVDYWNQWMSLWNTTMRRYKGEDVQDMYRPDSGDRRFKSEAWQENLLFDFIKQSYLMTSRWMQDAVRSTEGLDKDTKARLDFYTRQFADAMAPTNFVLTNPDVLKETIDSGGENLLRGLENLLEDMQRGGGKLKISTTDYKAFELGRNLAITPGKVVHQNKLMQLIQYAPAGEKTFKRPLLIIPPWINRYYILDMRPENSFVKWLTEQGHTVFMVSWVNPGPELSDMNFEDYMEAGIFEALEQIEKATGVPDANVIGYCIGGTLLSMALALKAARKEDSRIASATFLTTLIDFEEAGEMKLFTDEMQIERLDKAMQEKGVLTADHLQQTFSILRANDLIWSFVINNYLMGKEPFPFDLLFWNDDSTNMPGALHSFYLKNMYRDNLLCRPGGISLDGTPLNVAKIKTPAYFLSTREDHIAPWKATYAGAKLFSGPTLFTLAASGHIAGVVNPPGKNKYCYWTSEALGGTPDEWMEEAAESKGSWWPHWQEWIGEHTGPMVPARQPGKGALKAIEDAPGSYVRRQAD